MKAANKNTIPITSESDILCAFRNLTSSYDERTLHKWINFFKKCMYYASSDYSNPMFLSLTYNAVKKSEQYPYEFLYIHKLMYQFLCLRPPCFLQFPPYTDLASEYDRTAIKWNVPAIRSRKHGRRDRFSACTHVQPLPAPNKSKRTCTENPIFRFSTLYSAKNR